MSRPIGVPLVLPSKMPERSCRRSASWRGGDVVRSAGLAPVEFGLNRGFVQRDACRAAVEDAADGNAVAFTKGGKDEVLTDAVSAHRWVP